MSQQIIAGRINYPESDADPVRIMRCDPILDVRITDGNINISNLDIEGATVEISGAVTVDKITSTVTVSGTISGDVRVVSPVEISGNVDVSGNVRVVGPVEISGDLTISDTVTTSFVEADRDAFGRLRISAPYTLFEFTSIHPLDMSNDLKFDISLTGNASISNQDSVNFLNVHTIGDKAIVQSRDYIMYQPGKSRLTYLTGVLNPSGGFQGTSLIGSFDASSGYAFGYDSGGVFIIERSYATDEKVYQSSWNGDKLSDISFDKAQIFTMDQEWLGVGQVRLGVIDCGRYRICQTFKHKNELTGPYFATAKLPIRYEITSGGSYATLRMMCGTVLSEGGFNALGNKHGTSRYATLTQYSATPAPVFSIKLRETYPYINTTIKIQQIDLINGSNSKNGYWTILHNPTSLSGSFTNHNSAHSSAQVCYHVDGDTVSGGTVITSGFLPASGNVELVMTPDAIVRSQGIGRTIDGQSDIFTLTIQSFTGTVQDSIYGTMNWLEIR